MSTLVVTVLITRLVIPGGNDIGAGEPAIEIDIGATLRAERLVFLDRRLAADRAFLFGGHQTPDRLD